MCISVGYIKINIVTYYKTTLYAATLYIDNVLITFWLCNYFVKKIKKLFDFEDINLWITIDE